MTFCCKKQRKFNNVAGIILAAGASSRFGGNKLLVEWNGIPLLRHICIQALASELNRVVVVINPFHKAVRKVLAGLPVSVVYNFNSKDGQSTSIKAGISFIKKSDAVVIILADQPFLDPELLNLLIYTWHEKLSAIVAPYVSKRRANPVLFDQRAFPDLRNLTGDTGGKQLFPNYAVERVEWGDSRILYDIDSKQQLNHLITLNKDA